MAETARVKTITCFEIEGFKAFRDAAHVQIRPLTLLAGANSAGKSSVMQPLLLLKQTLETQFDPGPLLIKGPLARFDQVEQLIWKGRPTDIANPYTWSVQLNTTTIRVKLTFRNADNKIYLVKTEDCGVGFTLEEGAPTPDLPEIIRNALGDHIEHQRDRCRHVLVGSKLRYELLDVGRLNDIIHLPGLRGVPERTYPVTGETPHFSGPFYPYVASLLLQAKESETSLIDDVGNDLRDLGLTSKIEPRRRFDTEVELHVGRLPVGAPTTGNDFVNIADVGFGVSQVLPVVVALRAAKPGQLVHIEQPELHLHPNAQIALAALLVRAANRQVKVVVETHSSVLLLAIQRAIAANEIEPDNVMLHWFSRGADGAARMDSVTPDDAGAYGEWPVDFASVELELNSRYLDAAFSKLETASAIKGET